MYPSHMFRELRDRRLNRSQRHLMHLFFTAVGSSLATLSVLCFILAQIIK